MPSEEWKIRNFKQKWYAGETISVGIGQGAVATTPIQLARAIGAIASGGLLQRPHVINPTDLPANVLPTDNKAPTETRVPLDPANWELITDAMANVVSPIGTANSAHLQGIDFAGKTGSAQTISNMAKARMANGKAKFKDNGWFAGVEPRRDPEIVVCALLEEGEHGYLAARVASQVIKAYVEKQRRQPTKVAGSGNGKIEIGAVWSDSGGEGDASGKGDHMHSGRFSIDLARKRAPLAMAAPGLH
jgi:penicillin-binding protein 2